MIGKSYRFCDYVLTQVDQAIVLHYYTPKLTYVIYFLKHVVNHLGPKLQSLLKVKEALS